MKDIKIHRVFDTQFPQGSERPSFPTSFLKKTTTFFKFTSSENVLNRKMRDFKLFQKKLGALKGKYFWEILKIFFFNMDKKFIEYLESWKNMVAFFFQNVQKMFKILVNTTMKFSPKSGQKIIHYIFLNYRGICPSSPYFHFRRGLRPLHPLKGLPLPGPGWKTIDWNSRAPQFSMNFHDNPKNKNRKNDFTFDSAHYA